MSALRIAALAAIASLGLTLAAGQATAQAGIASEEECARLPSAEEELACLRGALAASRRALAQANGEDAEPGQETAPLAPPQGQELATAPAASPPTSGAPVLGQEQVARANPAAAPAEEDRSDRLLATVTDMRTDVRGLLVMQLDNGQIWRQDESVGGPIQLSENQAVGVEISRSGFGGYRMRFPELGRRIAVSRLR